MKRSSYILPKGVLATKDIILMVIILPMNGERRREEGRRREKQLLPYLGKTAQ
jgi:hypothetical protein